MAGIFNIIGKFFGNKSQRDVKKMDPILKSIHEEFSLLSNVTDDDLRTETKNLKKIIAESIKEENEKIKGLKSEAENNNKSISRKEDIYNEIDQIHKEIIEKIEHTLSNILPKAFAIIKETSRRLSEKKELIVSANEFDKKLAVEKDFVLIKDDKAIYKNRWTAAGNEVVWDMIHYDVQLIGGIVLHEGKIAEMHTGEGKTLAATLPIYLNALTGLGVHLVTVNDYLAKRDAEWMGPLFQFHGLSVDCIDNHQPNSEERRLAYMADITYGTNNEFGFDYLRDNMARRANDLVQRKLHYAIVDEVDSVLIDDARTPLIISGPTPRGDKHEYNEFKNKVSELYNAQKKYVSSILAESKRLIKEGKTEEGGFNLLRSFRGLPKNKALIKFLSEEGVKAQLQKTENFYMQDQSKEMHKVDEELFFVIDEKVNSIELTEKGLNLMTKSIEDKDFFIMPDFGEEMANIERENISEKEKSLKKESLRIDFSIKSERIHTVNQLLKAYALFEKDVEYVVIDNKVKIVDEQTGRIMEGRRYSSGLHQAIEAKENVKIEAATQTYATVTLQNYFRMYDKLSGMTGTAETEAGEFWEIYKLDVIVIPTNRPIARDDRNDLIYKTNREKYTAIIDEIVSLTKEGRPVLVGTTSVEISELLSKILTRRSIKHQVLNAKLHQKESDIVAKAGQESAVTIATNMAGRGTDIKLSKEVKEFGGLAIIGTERHDSRRVDRQLRGRSGRQGDPGSSQFYVSLEDNLMRMFGSDRIAKLMDRMGLEEGEVIQHSLVNKSISNAQKKVEENNFGIRKRLLEYDDVMNQQREVMYKKRRHALLGERLSLDISNMIYDTCESIFDQSYDIEDYEEFKLNSLRILAIDPSITESEFTTVERSDLIERIFEKTYENYIEKSKNIADQAFPVIKQVYENESAKYENIVIPFTDGIKTLQVVTNLKEAYEKEGKNISQSIEKSVVLAIIDDIWKEHLREMDDLKQSVQNQAYAQKDPLLMYKLKSFDLFKVMLDKVNKEIISFLLKSGLPQQSNIQEDKHTRNSNLQTSRPEMGISQQRDVNSNQQKPIEKAQPVRVGEKIGRNDPCPCGSGKKYKKCCGK